jgi:hypothetical protein
MKTQDPLQRTQKAAAKALLQVDLLFIVFEQSKDDDVCSKKRALFLDAAEVCKEWYYSSARVLWSLAHDPRFCN